MPRLSLCMCPTCLLNISFLTVNIEQLKRKETSVVCPYCKTIIFEYIEPRNRDKKMDQKIRDEMHLLNHLTKFFNELNVSEKMAILLFANRYYGVLECSNRTDEEVENLSEKLCNVVKEIEGMNYAR